MMIRIGVLLLVFCIPAMAGAQFIDEDMLGGFAPENQLVLDPTTPEPGQVVKVSLDDYAGGLFGANITWQYNGQVISGEQNQRQIEVVAGPLGETRSIEAILSLPGGITDTISADITPVYLDIIIEPQTRIPDWFAGRAMPSLGSQINATAVVSTGSIINPLDYVYTWQVNQDVIEGGPLRGRNSVSFETPRGRDFIIYLTVARTDGTVIATEAKRVPIVNPELAFYEQHPLYGAQPFPLDNSFALVSSNITLQAEPFYLDTRVYNDPDVVEWELNRTSTSNGSGNPYEITLQRTTFFGNTTIGFHVRSLQQVLQGVEDSVTITF